MAADTSRLSQLIDDYIVWFATWHRLTALGRFEPVPPPASFATWRLDALKSLYGAGPAIERVTALHEQLHTLVKLVLIKEAETKTLDTKDDESIIAKYLELMQELRRFERAFAAAASDLDPLTGLRTRLTMAQDLEREISRTARSKRPFYLAILDIDHFKTINDTYGHENGDRVLVAIADQISRGLRGHDDAYRIGGEEFLLCLKETDAAGCAVVLERLRLAIEKNQISLSDGRTVSVTASLGVTACNGNGSIKSEALMRAADQALYRAKNEGRNSIIVGS